MGFWTRVRLPSGPLGKCLFYGVCGTSKNRCNQNSNQRHINVLKYAKGEASVVCFFFCNFVITLYENCDIEHRDVGKAAVEKSKRKILNDTDIENTYFSILRFENAYACLGKLFEHGRNFVIQPDLLNRNFLLHGMLTRRVTKRDCDQLFLLYYNWLPLLEKH